MSNANHPTFEGSRGSSGQAADLPLALGLSAVLLFFLVAGGVSYWNTRALRDDTAEVTRTHEVLTALRDLLSILKDAETGQRGFVITGDERYLEPYNLAIARLEERVEDVDSLTRRDTSTHERLAQIRANVRLKLAELKETVDLRRTGGFDAARTVIVSDRGKGAMDAVRGLVGQLEQSEREHRSRQLASMEDAYRTAVLTGGLTTLLGALLSAAVGSLVRRAMVEQRRQEWLLRGQSGLQAAMLGEQRLEALGGSILQYLAHYVQASAGAFFAQDGARFKRISTYGVPPGGAPDSFGPSDGLLGQAVKDRRTFVLERVPEGYLKVGSALGDSKPRDLIVSPATAEGEVTAVFELGFLRELDPTTKSLLEQAAEAVGMAVRAANYRAHLQNLLEETQRQSEELQAQGEELRVSNEELEEQGRALRESQSRLERQQAELEQTNAQLEEQAQQLEGQRDDLERTKQVLQAKANELDLASRYKSDFLANMSHELRTPLNSSLILAKLLADNPQGNLSDEQVKYAETIRSAGNDLLNLINDILDLSKIEAGRMEIRAESFRLADLIESLLRTFQPIAEQKGLKFSTHVGASCPETLESDRQRLEQVLKNLLSNAFKFTEEGNVSLEVSCLGDGRLNFAVADTGIGIAPGQQRVVFEAFRQADGTTNRKYGGTGLGLSISREFARLLGGEIRLVSEAGKGSTFTLSIPESYDASRVAARPVAAPPTPRETPVIVLPSPAPAPRPRPVRAARIEDDRERLTNSGRLILVVEDDLSFARILCDLAHELDFQCLIAATAEEGLALAAQHLPSAVVLDVGLPDHSGLTVLDRLKHDSRTRHIPVHVVSAGDYAETAMSLGAVGYMLKPVKREELVDALERLETRLAQRLRRILIVEDDATQRESLGKLLGGSEVQTIGVGSAAECMERLRGETFDCMVLDLSLPDASGYSLLETLSREDAYSFPPVIVYTGRDLSVDEETQLRKYSKSIIIKGAKSPERLLDEVTLFLHQVVSDLPAEQQKMLEKARSRDAALEGRRILVVEDDVRNVFALTSILEPRGAVVQIARNGVEALEALDRVQRDNQPKIDLVLMDVMMPEKDGLTATRELRLRPECRKLPVIMLTAKAMKDDQERCLDAGANDYMAKPLDVEKLLSLVRVWMPR